MSDFVYERYEIDTLAGEVRFYYSAGEYHFVHRLTLDLSSVDDPARIETAVFSLGMAEMINYYKAICSPQIRVEAGYLDEEQIAFWVNLFRQGLGEFFYVNKIDGRQLINIVSTGSKHDPLPSEDWPRRVLLPLGGGKDSIVSAEILRERGIDFTWYMLEPLPAMRRIIQVLGGHKAIEAGRDIQSNFDQLQQIPNAPDGHIPISSIYAFSAALIAVIHRYTHIAVSNERSAEQGNIEYLGEIINHQYSKTFHFERAVHGYIQQYISPDIYYFSLLRNLYEIQIMERFAQYPQYWSVFISCNVGQRQGYWCGQCAKCAFVFATLSAFVSPDEASEVFGNNLFKNEALLPLYDQLLGNSEHKPFDCVGTPEETLLALYLAAQRYDDLPPILRQLDLSGGAKLKHLLAATTDQHLIPPDFV